MVLAESIGSVAVIYVPKELKVVGLEINANHVRSAREGRVRRRMQTVASRLRVTRWEIEIFDEEGVRAVRHD
ncbi:hotdog fold thioesterase [Shigella flexneri]